MEISKNVPFWGQNDLYHEDLTAIEHAQFNQVLSKLIISFDYLCASMCLNIYDSMCNHIKTFLSELTDSKSKLGIAQVITGIPIASDETFYTQSQ